MSAQGPAPAPDPRSLPTESQAVREDSHALPWFETWKQVIIAELLSAFQPRRNGNKHEPS